MDASRHKLTLQAPAARFSPGALSPANTAVSMLRVLSLAKTSSPIPMTPVVSPSATEALRTNGASGTGGVLSYAAAEALKGGIPGLIAMAIQVLALMWLRTTMNYQYRYGTSMKEAMQALYAQGGIRRFYQGLLPALFQGPLSRFGDTAANAGVMAFFKAASGSESGVLFLMARLPLAIKSFMASLAAAVFRILLSPVDTVKTAMQVEGDKAIPMLAAKIRRGGLSVLFHGALASAAATFAGHYPWFLVYNTLDATIPKPPRTALALNLLRSAMLGFFGSLASDLAANALRVIKTAKQTAETPTSYTEAIKAILEKEGPSGLFIRGLGTKILCNGIQGTLFSVLWRLGQERIAMRKAVAIAAATAAAAAASSAG